MEYPEHEKIKDLNGRNDVIGQFLEWLLYEKDYIIADRVHNDWCESLKDEDALCNCKMPLAPTAKSIEKIIGEHFNIDSKKLEKEKQAMLGVLRDQATKSS